VPSVGGAPQFTNGASGYDRVEYRYNAQGQEKQVKDQNQTVHDYIFDALGRQTSDQATLATGNPKYIDTSVLRIDRSYEVRGMVEKITSYSSTSGGTGNIVNQVLDEYNEWGLATAEYQSHVAGQEATTNSPHVGYSYDLSASGGVVTKALRPTGITYPNGVVLSYVYDSGNDDALNRVSSFAEGGLTLVQYTYLGLSQILSVSYPIPPGGGNVVYDLAHQDAGGNYDRLDQFGRVKESLWTGYYGDQVDLKYGYDAARNRIYRQDVLAEDASANLDELCGRQKSTSSFRGNLI
jgi:hypothetical protein